MARVWNITDHPKTERRATVCMVLGRSVRPGRSINVPDERLKNAHKVHRAVTSGKLHIGPKPPEDYLLAKRPKKAELDPGVARAHGMPDLDQISKEAVAKLENPPVEKVEAASEAEAPADQTPSEEDEGKSSKRRGRRGRS